MSCFVVNDYHVNALVAWGARLGVIPGISPAALAHELASANRAAFEARYAMPQPFEGFDFELVDVSHLVPVVIVKACDCLDYQASDWTPWAGSEACAHLAAIRAAALALALAAHRITPGPNAGGMEYGRELPGYDAATWELAEPVAPVVDRLAAALTALTGPELAGIRAAMAARGAA